MKKATKVAKAAALAAMVAMVGAMPVNAANTESAHSDITLFVPNDPVYTITVPETISLDAKGHTQVPITASDVKYIPEGKKVSVTLAKGSGNFGRLYMQGTNEETGKKYLMTLEIKGTDGEFKSGALEKQIKGMELASFTEDGTVNYEMYPCSQDYPQYEGKDSNLAIQKGVHYTAWADYGIALVDAE
ncbi:hypothetical protein ACTNB0_11030 [Lachnospiraceae bacterium HCP28S3_F9]